MSVLALQHVDVERLSLLEDILAQKGIASRYVALHKGERLPRSLSEMEGAEAIVVLGGPMGVYEEEKCPWLADEIHFIGEAVHAGLPVYGLCLGAQLMAAALGARVYPGEGKKEIGWFPVDLTPQAQGDPLLGDEEPSFPVFQWHGIRSIFLKARCIWRLPRDTRTRRSGGGSAPTPSSFTWKSGWGTYPPGWTRLREI